MARLPKSAPPWAAGTQPGPGRIPRVASSHTFLALVPQGKRPLEKTETQLQNGTTHDQNSSLIRGPDTLHHHVAHARLVSHEARAGTFGRSRHNLLASYPQPHTCRNARTRAEDHVRLATAKPTPERDEVHERLDALEKSVRNLDELPERRDKWHFFTKSGRRNP